MRRLLVLLLERDLQGVEEEPLVRIERDETCLAGQLYLKSVYETEAE